MATPTEIIALFFVILGILGFLRWWRMGFRKTKYPIWPFVLLVVAIWAILITVSWFTDSKVQFNETVATGKGYLIGMLAMYIVMSATKRK